MKNIKKKARQQKDRFDKAFERFMDEETLTDSIVNNLQKDLFRLIVYYSQI